MNLSIRLLMSPVLWAATANIISLTRVLVVRGFALKRAQLNRSASIRVWMKIPSPKSLKATSGIAVR